MGSRTAPAISGRKTPAFGLADYYSYSSASPYKKLRKNSGLRAVIQEQMQLPFQQRSYCCGGEYFGTSSKTKMTTGIEEVTSQPEAALPGTAGGVGRLVYSCVNFHFWKIL
jgi:hypothetical protein